MKAKLFFLFFFISSAAISVSLADNCSNINLVNAILQTKEVNKQIAEKVATKAFAGLVDNKNKHDFQIKKKLTIKSEEKTTFYIVNFKPTVLIFLSASDAIAPILDSSIDSNFRFDNLPHQVS